MIVMIWSFYCTIQHIKISHQMSNTLSNTRMELRVTNYKSLAKKVLDELLRALTMHAVKLIVKNTQKIVAK